MSFSRLTVGGVKNLLEFFCTVWWNRRLGVDLANVLRLALITFVNLVRLNLVWAVFRRLDGAAATVYVGSICCIVEMLLPAFSEAMRLLLETSRMLLGSSRFLLRSSKLLLESSEMLLRFSLVELISRWSSSGFEFCAWIVTSECTCWSRFVTSECTCLSKFAA